MSTNGRVTWGSRSGRALSGRAGELDTWGAGVWGAVSDSWESEWSPGHEDPGAWGGQPFFFFLILEPFISLRTKSGA